MMFSDKQKYNYLLIQNVYGNYTQFEQKITQPIVNYQKTADKIKTLEIGCGTGITTEIIFNSRDDIEKVTAIDNDKGMLEIIKKYFKNSRLLNKLETKLFDVVNNSLEKLSIDEYNIIVSAYTIHNFTKVQREQFFKTLFSLMKKNTLFINADKYAPDNDNIRIKALNYRIEKYIHYLLPINKLELLKEWVCHYIDDQSPEKVMKETESIELLKAIGFKDVKFVHCEGELEMMKILTAKKTIE